MKKVLLSILGLILILSLSAFPQTTELISNGGFENWTVNGAGGPPDDWSISGGSLTATQEGTTVRTGSYSVNLTWTTTSTRWIEQIVSVVGGRDYQFKFYVYDNDPDGRARVAIRWFDASSSLISGYYGSYSSDSPDWQLLDSGQLTAPANAAYAHMEIRVYDVSGWDGDATVYIDDASFLEYTTSALTISNVSRNYTVPTSSQNLTVTCDVTGGTPPYTVLLKYSVNGVAQADVNMTNTGGDTYSGDIPAQSDGARVEYYIEASDAGKTTTTSSTYGLFWGTSPISNAANGIKEVDANGALKYTDYYARVTGTATVSNGVFSSSNLEVYMQDAVGGICVFKSGAGSTAFTAGHSYTVVGKIDQYKGKSEIIPDDVSTDIIDNGAVGEPSPLIKTISQLLADPETYEGMLVGIMHMSKVSGSWPSSGSSANLTMSDDGGTSQLTLRVDSDTDLDDNPEPSWPKDVVGIFSQYDGSSPYDEGYQIMPRSISDIHDDGSLPVTLASFTAHAGNNQVTLQWITESEVNNVGFEILRATSEDGEYTRIASYDNNPALRGHLNSNTRHVYQYTDRLVMNGLTYWYKLVDVDLNGRRNVHGPLVVTPNAAGSDLVHTGNIPKNYALYPNYPNPFNPGTTLKFDIPASRSQMVNASLIVYNALGQQVKVLYKGQIAPGSYRLYWDGTNQNGAPLSSGIYYAVLKTDRYTKSVKMILMK